MNPDVKKRMHQLFNYMTLTLFPLFYIKSFHINLFELDVHCALKTRLFQQLFSSFLKDSNEMCKRMALFKLLSS